MDAYLRRKSSAANLDHNVGPNARTARAPTDETTRARLTGADPTSAGWTAGSTRQAPNNVSRTRAGRAGVVPQEALVSLLGRREGLPSRTVLIPVGHPHRRTAGSHRFVVVTGLFGLALAGAIAAAILLGSRSGHVPAAPPRTPPAPAAPRSRPPHLSAAALLAQARERGITRLAGLGVPVFCGAPRGNELALTFDDGPGLYTAKVLAILRRFHAQATFFLVGNRIRFWPRLPAAEARLGSVGDHTWSHADLAHLPRPAGAAEVER